MRISCFLLLIVVSITLYSQENPDNSKRKLKAGASVSLNSNGIASIPAFSLDKPAVMASLSFVKNRFSYEPLLAYSLEMKPWFIDNWLHYKIVARPAFELRTGFNFSTFFTQIKQEDETILKGERYFALELTSTYRISPNATLLLAYWNDRGQEPGTISGHYLNFVAERTDWTIGSKLLLSGAIQVFYINYDGNNDGLFVSPRASAAMRNFPFSVFFQAIQPVVTNIEPSPGFRWNIGLSYTL